jgi:hypothetical protein
MPKFTLDIEYEYDFELIGISCHLRDYKLCWALNKHLGFNFSRGENLILRQKTGPNEFSNFVFEDEDNRLNYSLISNKGSGGFLVPELKHADYLLKVAGTCDSLETTEFLKTIKGLEVIITAFPVDISNLKSKQNLLLE